MLLTDARLRVRAGARNAGDTAEFSHAQVDYAIQVALDYLLARQGWPVLAREIRVEGEALVDLSGGSPASFRPDLLVDARMGGAARPLELPTWAEFVDRTRGMGDGRTGEPLMLAFEADTEETAPVNYTTPYRAVGYLWPLPGDAWDVLRLRWRAPLTAWTPGDAGAATIPLACAARFVPDDWLRVTLATICPALLQGVDPEHGYGQTLRGWYEQTFTPMFGGGRGLGGRSTRGEMSE